MKRYPVTLWKFLEGQDFGVSERLDIAIKLVKEVKMAHDAGVVHRDLKPTNIMLDANKELTLVDFGIGRDMKSLKGSCGTPGFNAPEQFSGDEQQKSVDIFSLGKNLALIFFEWEIGWKLLWSSKNWISSQKIAEKKLFFLLFFDFFDIIRQMLQVNSKNNLNFFIVSISKNLNIFFRLTPENVQK